MIMFSIYSSSLNIDLLQDWDQVSIYSGRSIPRPRVYQMEHPSHIPDELRSHLSQFSTVGTKMGKLK